MTLAARTTAPPSSATCAPGSNVNTCSGGPSFNTGWFVGAGVKINVPSIGPGDYFSAQVNYAEGATGYAIAGATNGGTIATGGPGGYYGAYSGNASYGFGVISDGVFAAGTSIHLTTVWGVNAAYEHHWNKKWQTSIYGAYLATSYDAVANTQLCALESFQMTTIGVRQQLAVLGRRYPDPVQRRLADLHRSRRDLHQAADGERRQHRNDQRLRHPGDDAGGRHDRRSERVDGGVPLPPQLLSLIG